MRWLFYLIATGLFLVSLIGFCGNIWVPFDLFSHFRIQYFFLLLFCAFYFVFSKKWSWILLCLLFLGVNAFELYPLYIADSHVDIENNESLSELSLLNLNIEFTNRNSLTTLQEIEAFDADIVVLVEYTSWWDTALSGLEEKYPYKEFVIQTTNNFGICIYSRLPLSGKETHYFNKIDTPVLEMIVDADGKSINLFAFHPPAPVSSVFGFWGRDKVYHGFADYLEDYREERTIVIGDFNASAFSHIFKSFEQEAELKNSQKGYGWQGSWPSQFFPLHISIDHCLMSEEFTCTKRAIGNVTDSDHLPVYVELVFD